MAYIPKTRFERKDALPQDDPNKIIYGSEFAVEFDAISATFSDVQGGFDEVKNKLEAGGYSMEEAPAGGAQYGRQEKNGTMTWTEIGSAGSITWSEVSGKPSTFPPSPHNHDGQYLKTETDPTVPAHVKAITQTNIDSWNAGGSGGASTWDELTGKPAEFPPESHTHEQSEVDGLELRLNAIEDSITDGGGFVDAPDDGKLYGRQSENWAEVPDGGVSDWADIENKPTEFPPADHNQPWSTITDTPDDYPPEDHTHDIANIDGLQDALDNAGGVTYTLPVVLRSGSAQLPLTADGAKLAVMTRGGELELPLAA
jgi:hypothetical protein